ncbi:hypothetical protein FPRO04_09563 [Fusarium proliferatum]|nr:hypothetical protein FPRO04_09563 [Fusarium proliferatum]
MKTYTILTALGSILAFNTQAFVWDACYGSQGMFSGQFRPGQTKSMCPRSVQVGLVFEVQNQWDQTLDLNNDDCYTRLKNEIYGCDRGGESTVSKWRFRADPGNC